jgi:hypothetical protein
VVLNATFNNISVISWQSVLLVEETGIPGEKPSKKTQQKLIQQRSNFIYIVIYLINKNIYILVLVHLVQIDIAN